MNIVVTVFRSQGPLRQTIQGLLRSEGVVLSLCLFASLSVSVDAVFSLSLSPSFLERGD